MSPPSLLNHTFSACHPFQNVHRCRRMISCGCQSKLSKEAGMLRPSSTRHQCLGRIPVRAAGETAQRALRYASHREASQNCARCASMHCNTDGQHWCARSASWKSRCRLTDHFLFSARPESTCRPRHQVATLRFARHLPRILRIGIACCRLAASQACIERLSIQQQPHAQSRNGDLHPASQRFAIAREQDQGGEPGGRR
jgi:hypothetical protein